MRLIPLALIIIVSSTVIVQLPNLVAGNAGAVLFLKGLSIVPFIFFIVLFFFRRVAEKTSTSYNDEKHKLLYFVCYAFVFLEIISIWRGFMTSIVSLSSGLYLTCLLLLILAFSHALGLINQKEGLGIRMEKIVRALYLSIFFYLAINIIFYVIGLSGESLGDSKMLNLLGLESSRVRFALSNGWNSFGVLSGAAIVAGLLLYSRKKARILDVFLTYGLLVLGMICVLAVDSRGALLMSLLTFMVVRISLFVKPVLLKFFVTILPLLPLSILLIPIVIDSSFVDYISRNPDEISNFNGRLIIWLSAFSMYDGLSLNLFLGHGMFGHYAMGVTNDVYIAMSDIGMDIEGPADLSMHNSYIQHLVDQGILGSIFLYSLLLGVVSKLLSLHSKYPEYKFDVILGLIVYFMAIGNFEVVASANHESNVLLVLILFLVTFSFKVKKQNGNKHDILC